MKKLNKYSIFEKKIINFIKNNFNMHLSLGYIFIFLFLFLLLNNLLSIIPMAFTMTLMYSFMFIVSFSMLMSLWAMASYANMTSFLSHFLPSSSPNFLLVFLPLIELVSSLLRPLTLAVRIATNMAAGHIMLFIFSYFTLKMMGLISIPLYVMITALLLLESGISVLQAYIYVNLNFMYTKEMESLMSEDFTNVKNMSSNKVFSMELEKNLI